MSHSDESPLTDQDVLSSESPNQDSQQANLDVPSSDQDTTTAATQERRGISEVSGKLSSLLSMYLYLFWKLGLLELFFVAVLMGWAHCISVSL